MKARFKNQVTGSSSLHGYNAFFVWKREALEENTTDRTNTRTPYLLIANHRIGISITMLLNIFQAGQ